MSREITFEALYQEHYPFIQCIVTAILNDARIVEEVVQDTFFEASKNMKLLSTHQNVRGWLITTAKYNIRDELKSKRNRRLVLLDDIDSIPAVPASYDDPPLRDMLMEVLDTQEAEMLLLHYEQGYSIAEIAEQIGITVGACKVRMHRTRRKFKESYKRLMILIVILIPVWSSSIACIGWRLGTWV